MIGRRRFEHTFDAHAFVRGMGLVLALSLAPATVHGQVSRTVAVTPGSLAHEYVITADTAVIDPGLTFENVGRSTVRGIRLLADDQDWTTIDGILAAILTNGMTPEQRARAIWQFARTRAYAWYTYSEFASEASDPVRFFNSYGYGLCSDFSAAMAALYARAGFPVRIWSIGHPAGHVVPEVFFDDGWHVMDANRNVLFLERDGRTIASVDALVTDAWLIDRAGPAFADLRALYASTPFGAYTDVVEAAATDLSFDLRPNERFEILAAPVGLYRQDTSTPTPTPMLYGNAVLTSRPDAATDDADEVFEPGHGLETAVTSGTVVWRRATEGPAPRYVVNAPHPVLAATLRVTARLGNVADRVSIYAARGTAGLEYAAGDLASGGAFEDDAVVSHEGLATVDEDGMFPVLHVGPTGHGALVLSVQRAGLSTPLVVRGTLFRFLAVDGLAIDVSRDGATWTQAWTPDAAAVGYVMAAVDVAPLVAGASQVYVRYRFDARSAPGWAAGANEIAIDGVVPAATTLVATMIAADAPTQEFDLTGIVAPARGAASYGYVLRFVFEGGAGIERFDTTSTLQVAPNLVPSPTRGTTAFALKATSGEASDLRITHTWIEGTGAEPSAPTAPLLPGRGEALSMSGPVTFSFVPSSSAPLENLRQYELVVCADATCASPLSSVTEVWSAPWQPGPDGVLGTVDDELGVSTTPSITLDAWEWFQPGQTYYWRVRALSLIGEWGPYSETWPFIATAGAGTAPTLTIEGPASDRTSTSPFARLSGQVSSPGGVVTVRWTTDRGASGDTVTASTWKLSDVPLVGGANVVTIVAVDSAGRSVTREVHIDVPFFSYYLAEGSTQADMETEIAIANPADSDAPVELHMMLDDGTTAVRTEVVPALSRATFDAVDLVGVARSFAIEVRSLDAVALAVERTMRWGPDRASGHSGSAVTAPSSTWYFAEGSQGYFDTFVLLANPNETDVLAVATFMTESGATVTYPVTVRARARETIWTRQFPQLDGQSFSISITSAAPLVAERAVYFGQPTWKGGHVSSGAPELATRWFCPEGATGPYLDTYVLVSNPSSSTASQLTVDYLTGTGTTVRELFTVPPHSRLTIDVESRSPWLRDAAVSTLVSSSAPVVVERATYWGGTFTQWHDGTASMGTTDSGRAWAVADVRVGGDDGYETWLLLTNETSTDIEVDLTVLPESGPPVTDRVTVPARARYNYYVNAERPELDGQRLGVRLVSVDGLPFAVERSQYWSTNGVSWSGGASSRATRLR